MVNKDRIKVFSRCSSNSIKSDKELRWEIKNSGIFRKKNPRQIHGIKNHSIWIKIRGEIKEQKLDRKSITRREETNTLSKI